jgi:hypothetical protein
VRRILLPALVALGATALSAAPVAAQAARKHTTTRKTTRKTTASTRASTAAGWTPVYTDNSVTVSLDRAGTKRRGDGTWDTHLKWAYDKDITIGRNKSYRTLVEHRYVDCKSLASKPVSGETYDAASARVSRYTTPARDLRFVDWATRPAGTSGAKAYAAVCAALGKR